MHHGPLKSTQFRSLLKSHFNQTQEAEEPVSAATLRPSSIESHWTERRGNKPCIHKGSRTCPEDSNIWCLVRSINSNMPSWARTLGLPLVTGSIHFESNGSRARYYDFSSLECMGKKGLNAIGSPTVWARLALPWWLSYKVLEVVAHSSRIRWKQYIRMRNVFPRLDHCPDTPFHEAWENIAFGKLQNLRTKIDKREVTP